MKLLEFIKNKTTKPQPKSLSEKTYLFIYYPNLEGTSKKYVFYNPKVQKYIEKFLHPGKLLFSDIYTINDKTVVIYGNKTPENPLFYSLILTAYAEFKSGEAHLKEYLQDIKTIDNQTLYIYSI